MGPTEIIAVALVGLIAGFFGALAGLGGSLFMLPLLSIFLGVHAGNADGEASSGERYHLFMAAAMCVNVLVSAPAAVKHWRRGVIRIDVIKWLVPVMAVAIAVGAFLSNEFDGVVLARILGVLIIGGILINLLLRVTDDSSAVDKAAGDKRHHEDEPLEIRQRAGLAATGGITGVVSGLMGIGGGVILVSGGQLIARLPLRHAIATSSASICVTALIGAAAKLSTLHEHNYQIVDALAMAAVMGAWGILGAMMGAESVHRVPTKPLKWVVSIILLLAAVRLATTGVDFGALLGGGE